MHGPDLPRAQRGAGRDACARLPGGAGVPRLEAVAPLARGRGSGRAGEGGGGAGRDRRRARPEGPRAGGGDARAR